MPCGTNCSAGTTSAPATSAPDAPSVQGFRRSGVVRSASRQSLRCRHGDEDAADPQAEVTDAGRAPRVVEDRRQCGDAAIATIRFADHRVMRSRIASSSCWSDPASQVAAAAATAGRQDQQCVRREDREAEHLDPLVPLPAKRCSLDAEDTLDLAEEEDQPRHVRQGPEGRERPHDVGAQRRRIGRWCLIGQATSPSGIRGA